MPKFTQEQVNKVLDICSNDKCTAGNIKKIRNYARSIPDTEREFKWYVFDVASMLERDLTRKAAARRGISVWAKSLNKTDQEKAESFPGCVGFTTVYKDL